MDKVEILRRARLFDMLSPTELEAIADLSKPFQFRAGDVIFQEGDVGECLYVIANGEVEVTVRDSSGEQKSLVLLSAPDVFGEMSLIDKEARSATIRAHSDGSALMLTADNFNTFRKHSRDGFTFVIMNIARLLSGRLRETNGRLATRI